MQWLWVTHQNKIWKTRLIFVWLQAIAFLNRLCCFRSRATLKYFWLFRLRVVAGSFIGSNICCWLVLSHVNCQAVVNCQTCFKFVPLLRMKVFQSCLIYFFLLEDKLRKISDLDLLYFMRISFILIKNTELCCTTK